MNKIRYYKNILCEYDHTFKDTYYFDYEISDTVPCKLIKKNRKVLSSNNFDKYVYISSLNYQRKDKGILIQLHDKKVYLVNVGNNVYFLAFTDLKDIQLYSILHTFMQDNNCYIDVSKYPHLFKSYNILSLYILQ